MPTRSPLLKVSTFRSIHADHDIAPPAPVPSIAAQTWDREGTKRIIPLDEGACAVDHEGIEPAFDPVDVVATVFSAGSSVAMVGPLR